jgi:hypothetical protein
MSQFAPADTDAVVSGSVGAELKTHDREMSGIESAGFKRWFEKHQRE